MLLATSRGDFGGVIIGELGIDFDFCKSPRGVIGGDFFSATALPTSRGEFSRGVFIGELGIDFTMFAPNSFAAKETWSNNSRGEGRGDACGGTGVAPRGDGCGILRGDCRGVVPALRGVEGVLLLVACFASLVSFAACAF